MSPHRPREHVLEGLSRRAFEAALPAEWVVRAVEDDYGIDREVEIFLDGRATGLMFEVQLKASDRVSRSGPSRRVTTGQIAYWNSLDVPVLIVYWVVEAQSLYGRWAHTLGREAGLQRGAATATVAYGDHDLLTGRCQAVGASDASTVHRWSRSSSRCVAGFTRRPHPPTLVVPDVRTTTWPRCSEAPASAKQCCPSSTPPLPAIWIPGS